MNEIIKTTYRHYKGNLYEVLHSAKHSETLEEMIVYKALYDDSIWVRPFKMFFEDIEIDGKIQKRFELVK